MPTVDGETKTIIRRTNKRTRPALQQFHQLMQEYGEEDVRTCLGADVNDTIIEACHLLFGAQISLFGKEVPNPNT